MSHIRIRINKVTKEIKILGIENSTRRDMLEACRAPKKTKEGFADWMLDHIELISNDSSFSADEDIYCKLLDKYYVKGQNKNNNYEVLKKHLFWMHEKFPYLDPGELITQLLLVNKSINKNK